MFCVYITFIRKYSYPFNRTRYGVESWRFYFSNLFVNFNASLAFVCVALSLGLKRVFSNRVGIVCFASALIWFSAMQSRPHKEERFLFVIYPCICVLASYVLPISDSLSLHPAYIEFIFTKKPSGTVCNPFQSSCHESRCLQSS